MLSHKCDCNDFSVVSFVTEKKAVSPTPRSNEKNKKITPNIRELFSLFKV